MDNDNDWNDLLKDHPIFEYNKDILHDAKKGDTSLELSVNTLSAFTRLDPVEDVQAPSGRRQVMIIKDADIIVAAGHEIRMAALGDARLGRSIARSYKKLYTPNINFEIHHMALNPNGKLLAVAGAFQVAVVVLPRTGFTKLVPTTVDCKSLQVGQFYHASKTSVPLAKVDWHPWGEGGSTLMVMSVDGTLREYDISVDVDEPQQVLSFVPERKANTFIARDSSEREVASFTLGKGKADWGPLSLYALMKSGDVYAICPYMPKNASIPSSYVHALECFVAAKQEFISQTQDPSSSSRSLSTLYDYQHKYVTGLLRQLPPGTVFTSVRSTSMHPPHTVKSNPVRQGPFLLQPSPRLLDGSEGGDATDIVYLAFGADEEGLEGETERLGVVLLAYQDGKVDVCLDVEKVEARWEIKPKDNELPMLAVYETIDLGIVNMLSKITVPSDEPPVLDLLQANHLVLLPDPIHDDTVYVYHAFGVHALQLGPVLQSLATALRDDTSETEDGALSATLQKSECTNVQPIITTFSVERRCSNPVVAVAVPNDVYLTYSIFILTSAFRMTVIPLSIQCESPHLPPAELPPVAEDLKSSRQDKLTLPSLSVPPAYISLLSEPYVVPPILARSSGLPFNPRLDTPSPGTPSMLTPDVLRYFATTVERFLQQIHDVQLAHHAAEVRAELHLAEFKRQREKCQEMQQLIARLKGPRDAATGERVAQVQTAQKALLARLDRTLRALMAKASPELSEHETKWFEELKRIKGDVIGAGRYDGGSLKARASLVEREYNRILPALRELEEKEKMRRRRISEKGQSLGVSQAFELGERSNNERAKLVNIEQEILRLATKLDMTLGRAPLQNPASSK